MIKNGRSIERRSARFFAPCQIKIVQSFIDNVWNVKYTQFIKPGGKPAPDKEPKTMTRNDMYLTGKTIKGRIRVLTNAKAAALALYEATKPAEIGPDATEAEEVAMEAWYAENRAIEAATRKAKAGADFVIVPGAK